MSRKCKLTIGVMFLIICLLLGLFIYNARVSKDVNKDSELNFETQLIEYWNNIMKEYESDINYIVEWLESHKRISRIYALDGNVRYERNDKDVFDLDNRITEFIKENDIDIIKPKEDDGNVILFTHKFFNKKRIIGNYVLIYYKDEKAAQDSYYALWDGCYKIKNNYYCYTTFYE